MNHIRDKFLTEAMGYVWHECQDNPDGFHCIECENGLHCTSQFNTWEGVGELWTWFKSQEQLWVDFKWNTTIHEMMELIDPDKFPDYVYNLLKENK